MGKVTGPGRRYRKIQTSVALDGETEDWLAEIAAEHARPLSLILRQCVHAGRPLIEEYYGRLQGTSRDDDLGIGVEALAALRAVHDRPADPAA